MPYTIPEYLVCQITGQIFFEPMLDLEGQAFEKEAIYKALECGAVNPLTCQPLTKEDLRRARQTESIVESVLREYPEIWEKIYFPEEMLVQAIREENSETVRAIFDRELTLSREAGKLHRFLTRDLHENVAAIPPGYTAYRLIVEQRNAVLLALILPLQHQVYLDAVKNNEEITVRQMLDSNPSLLDYCDSEGNNALHLCVMHKSRAVMRTLLIYGISYLSLNTLGRSAFTLMTESKDSLLINDFAQGLKMHEEKLKEEILHLSSVSVVSSSSSSSFSWQLSFSSFFQALRNTSVPHNISSSPPHVNSSSTSSFLSHEDLMRKMQETLQVSWDDVYSGIVVEQSLVVLADIHTLQAGASFRRCNELERFCLCFANQAEWQIFQHYYADNFPGFIKIVDPYLNGKSNIHVDVAILVNDVLPRMAQLRRPRFQP